MLTVLRRTHRRLAAARSAVRMAVARLRDPEGVALVREVRSRRLTYLEPAALLDLRSRVSLVERRKVPGAVLEAGCALGGSAIVLAGSKAADRPMFVYDVFSTIPSPSERDGEDVDARYAEISAGKAQGIDGDLYYGYQRDLKATVQQNFSELGVAIADRSVQLVEGLFEDTIRPQWPVALAHIDGDWYESVKTCLERIWPALSPGGVVVIDDYDSWSGCRAAVDDFLAPRSDYRAERWSRLHLVKT